MSLKFFINNKKVLSYNYNIIFYNYCTLQKKKKYQVQIINMEFNHKSYTESYISNKKSKVNDKLV